MWQDDRAKAEIRLTEEIAQLTGDVQGFVGLAANPSVPEATLREIPRHMARFLGRGFGLGTMSLSSAARVVDRAIEDAGLGTGFYTPPAAATVEHLYDAAFNVTKLRKRDDAEGGMCG
jgi:hypothetical protein